jgi:hypothetical protein
MTQLVEIEEQATEADSGPPIAHYGVADKRIALCGAEILGISVGDQPYVLCKVCERMRHFDYHPEWSAEGGPF